MAKVASVDVDKAEKKEKGRKWLLWVAGLSSAVVVLGALAVILFLGD